MAPMDVTRSRVRQNFAFTADATAAPEPSSLSMIAGVALSAWAVFNGAGDGSCSREWTQSSRLSLGASVRTELHPFTTCAIPAFTRFTPLRGNQLKEKE
jgi:hypothetical protein